MVEAVWPISSGSLLSLMSGGSPPVGPIWGLNKGATIARTAGCGIARVCTCTCGCVGGCSHAFYVWIYIMYLCMFLFMYTCTHILTYIRTFMVQCVLVHL